MPSIDSQPPPPVQGRMEFFDGLLTEAEAVELARKTIAKLGLPAGFVHTEGSPSIYRPTEVSGMPTFPRLQIEWNLPEQRIQIEVDCDKGRVESVSLDDSSFWGKPPPIDVPIRHPAATSKQ